MSYLTRRDPGLHRWRPVDLPSEPSRGLLFLSVGHRTSQVLRWYSKVTAQPDAVEYRAPSARSVSALVPQNLTPANRYNR